MRPNRLAMCARGAEVLLGIVFLAGAILKAAEIDLFVVQVSYYGVIPKGSWLLDVAAIGTVALETGLGAALVLGWRLRGLVLLVLPPLLVFYTSLIVYGWVFHDLKDCGCFGRIEVSPQAGIVKNIMLLVLWVVAWGGPRRKPILADAKTARAPKRVATAIKAAVCILLTVLVTRYALLDLGAKKMPPPGFPAALVFDEGGRQWDLGKGEYFVAVYEATCEHCMSTAPRVMELEAVAGFPQVIALCLGDQKKIDEFRVFTGADFPIHPIDIDVFNQLIGKWPPRFFHLRDGAVLGVWDDEPPKADEVVGTGYPSESKPR